MYKEQSARELRLHLLRGTLDLDQFTRLGTAALARGGLAVEASILGASHLVRLRWDGPLGGVELHEVFACTEVSADTPRCFSGGVRELPARVDLRPERSVRYRFAHRSLRASTGAPAVAALRRRIDAASATGAIGLSHRFPAEGPAGGAETLVWVDSDGGGRAVRVFTAHAYPNEDAVVFSTTRVRLCAAPT